MSYDAVGAFWTRVETDRVLSRELDGLLAGSGADREVHASALVLLARRHGFEFTEDELCGRAEACDDSELSERDLDAVAGGAQTADDAKIFSKYYKVEVKGMYGDIPGLDDATGRLDDTAAPVGIRIRV